MTDDELRQVASEFRDGVLGAGRSSDGMCFAVAMPLAGFLKAAYGVKCTLVSSDHSDNPNSEWYEHYWIRLADGRALDPTFDQFRPDEPVYIGKPTEFHASGVTQGRI